MLVATSILPGLHEKYPDALIDWYVRQGFDFALTHNPYINTIIRGPVPNEKELEAKYDLVIAPEHHYRWDKPMAKIHCEVAGVRFNPPELYLAQSELDIPNQYKYRILVANKAGWKSRTCPNLTPVLANLATKYPEMLQIDNGRPIGDIEKYTGKLRQIAALMYYAKAYIGIDTVFMHMAVALKKPMALCLGPTGPETQYIPDAYFIRPFVHLNPAQSNHAFSNGIQLPKESIEEMIVTLLDVIDSGVI